MSEKRSEQYRDGQRNALKWVVEWLSNRAASMIDPHAVQILNSASFALGGDKERFLRGEFHWSKENDQPVFSDAQVVPDDEAK